jgi:hypothetical protein
MQSPSERVKTRLLRGACSQVASERKLGLLDVEDTYQKVRTHLVHFHHQAPGTAMLEMRQHIEALLPAMRLYLAEASAVLPRERVSSISRKTISLSKAATTFLDAQKLVQTDLQVFLRVLEIYREKCLAARYDPSDIVPTEILLLCIMIESNFDIYGEALGAAI